MKSKSILTTLISVLCLISLVCGCVREPVPSEKQESGPASLQIVLNTKSTEADQGEEFNNLAIFLVDENGYIMGYANSDVGASRNSITISEDKQTAVASFGNIPSGDYTIYYIANRPSSLTLPNSYSTSTLFSSTGLADYTLPTLSGTNLPDYSSSAFNGMPITLIENTTINYGSNKLSARLFRSAAHFSVDIHSHMVNFKVCITDLSFSKFNPSDSYLFIHQDQDEHTLPAANVYRELPRQFNSFINLASGASAHAFDAYLYEGHADAYTMNIAGAVFKVTQNDVASIGINTTYDCAIEGREYGITDTSEEYFIESYNNSGMYLYMNGTSIAIGSLPSDYTTNPDGCKNYRWKFSGQSSGTVYNVGTGMYLYNSGSSLSGWATGSTYYFGTYSSTFFIRSSNTSGNKYYFVNSNTPKTLTTGASGSTNPNSNYQRWYLRQYTVNATENTVYYDAGGSVLIPEKIFEATDQQINYINSYGSASDLENLYRNVHVHNIINIYYNPTAGYFRFEVLPWEESISDITFE